MQPNPITPGAAGSGLDAKMEFARAGDSINHETCLRRMSEEARNARIRELPAEFGPGRRRTEWN